MAWPVPAYPTLLGDLHETFTITATFIVAALSVVLIAGSAAIVIRRRRSAAPKISAFAFADDLATEVTILVKDLQKAVADEEEFKSQVEGRFTRDGNTITLIAIALGLHDQDCPLKSQAGAIAAAARKLAAAKDFASTKQAVEDIQAAADGKGAGAGPLKWGKVSKLEGLMKDEVPAINNRLKTGLRKFSKRSSEVAANAADGPDRPERRPVRW